MNTNPLTKGVVAKGFTGIGTVTPQMVEKRAVELALINGRTADQVSETDFEQAKRELTGGPETDPDDVALEAVPESERWDPVRGSSGHQVPKSGDESEDDEGRSIGEQLVEEGISEAEHDQMLKGARKSAEEDQ